MLYNMYVHCKNTYILLVINISNIVNIYCIRILKN